MTWDYSDEEGRWMGTAIFTWLSWILWPVAALVSAGSRYRRRFLAEGVQYRSNSRGDRVADGVFGAVGLAIIGYAAYRLVGGDALLPTLAIWLGTYAFFGLLYWADARNRD